MCRLQDEAVRRRLLAERDLTLIKTLELSQAMETAKQLRENEPVSQAINKI